MTQLEDKFTPSVRLALTRAWEEAQHFNHGYIGTEHLLLGIVRDEQGTASRVLSDMGADLPKVRSTVEFIILSGPVPPKAVEARLTPRSKEVIERAVKEAQRLKHHYIGPEHLLLAIAREREGIGAGILESFGVNLEKLRKQVIRQMNEDAG